MGLILIAVDLISDLNFWVSNVLGVEQSIMFSPGDLVGFSDDEIEVGIEQELLFFF